MLHRHPSRFIDFLCAYFLILFRLDNGKELLYLLESFTTANGALMNDAWCIAKKEIIVVTVRLGYSLYQTIQK